jgi:hypothetical protein
MTGMKVPCYVMNQNFSIYLKINLVTKSHQTLSSFSNCENLIAEEGSILFCSKQIKQDKPNELPINIVVFATTSQILAIKVTVKCHKKEIRRRSRRILPL